MRLRKTAIFLAALILSCLLAFYFYARPKYVVPILMYHHIDQRGKTSSLSVSPENFARQMSFLSNREYNVISLREFVQAKAQSKKLRRNSVVLTFDDAYADNYHTAFPILKKYNLAATIFVIVDVIGQEGYLSYNQIKEMLASGIIDIGSHSLAGDYLPGQLKEQLEKEIGLSKKVLENKLDTRVDLFCYPIGGFTPGIQQMLKRYGYQGACTTNRGKTKTCFNNDIFALKRIKVTDSSWQLFVFWAKLSGYYNLFRRVREPY